MGHQAPTAEAQPLRGCRVVVTRPEGRGAELLQRLEAMGALVRHIPLIRTEPARDPRGLRQAVAEVWAGRFHWVVVTSPAGADAVADALEASRPPGMATPPARFCAVGPATRRALESRGLAVAAEPAEPRGSAVPEALRRQGELAGARVLLALADRAEDRLQEELGRLGAEAVRVTAYHTVEDPGAAARVARLLAEGEADVVVVASPSAVQALASALAGLRPAGGRGATVVAAAIGPTTARAAREAGFVTEAAASPTAEGVAQAVRDAWRTRTGGRPREPGASDS